jgi:hypothetical protein
MTGFDPWRTSRREAKVHDLFLYASAANYQLMMNRRLN